MKAHKVINKEAKLVQLRVAKEYQTISQEPQDQARSVPAGPIQLLDVQDKIQDSEDNSQELLQRLTAHPHKVSNLQAQQDLQEIIQLQELQLDQQAIILQAHKASIHRQQALIQVQEPTFQMCHQQVINHPNKAHILHKMTPHTRLQDPPERPHHAITCPHDEDKLE